ncbi:MAG: hypothetical protein PVI91_03275 [Gammaproteobacteria bacterium]
MKPYFKGLMRDVSRAADALRYADTTKFPLKRDRSTARQHRTHQPEGRFAQPSPTPRSTGPRRIIALVAERRLQPGALRYALSVCERLSARLEVLTGPALPNVELQLSRACQERDVPWRVVPIGSSLEDEIPHYVKTVAGLLFLVTGAGDAVAERVVHDGGRSRRFSGDVALVIVAEEGAVAA